MRIFVESNLKRFLFAKFFNLPFILELDNLIIIINIAYEGIMSRFKGKGLYKDYY